MARSVEAVYEGGALKPLEPVAFREGQRVRILVADEDPIELAGRVYDGLAEEEIAEIERVALARGAFFGERRRT